MDTFSVFSLSVAVFSTISVIQSQNLDLCNYIVMAFCTVDTILHLCNYKILKLDMILHHLFAIMISFYSYANSYPITYNLDDKYFLMTNQLSCEISTIFLNLMKVFPKKSYLALLNRLLFLVTFVYYRIYNYFVNIIISKNSHQFIIQIAKSNFHLFYMYTGVFGLFLLNIYWLNLILKKLIIR